MSIRQQRKTTTAGAEWSWGEPVSSVENRRSRTLRVRGSAHGFQLPHRLTCDAGNVSNYRVRFEGPAALAISVATALADADGVELISSDQPLTLDENIIALDVTVEGAFDAVADAVARIRGGMPTDASIEISSG